MKKKDDMWLRAAAWVEGHLPPIPGKEAEICRRLYGAEQKNVRYREWRIQQIRRVLLIAVCGGLLTLAAGGYGLLTAEPVTGLIRETQSRQYVLTARLGEEWLGEIPVEIPARRQTTESCELLLEEAADQLQTVILGGNTSLETVEQNLYLPETLCRGMVEIVWESSDHDLVDARGRVDNQTLQDASVVLLTARMNCQQKECSISFPVRVIPPQRDQTQRLLLEINRLLEEETEEDQMQERFRLPDSFEDLPLQWSFPQKGSWVWILLLTVAGCVGTYVAACKELQKEEQLRQQRLLYEYPGFLARLTMLTGTGMPVRVVLARLAADDRTSTGCVCRELRRLCWEMENGVTQKEALEHFGQRCRLPEYKKCAALLIQHLGRGTGGIPERLWQEAEDACDLRRAQARQKGEEAQTRLLLPMMLMLLVVMGMIMVPACFSFAGM